MKPRDAGTLEGAILDIVRMLGIERCADVVGKSTSLVRKWSDPDNGTLPSLSQALALDLEYSRELGGTPPLLNIYSRTIRKEIEVTEGGEHILTALLSFQTACCTLNTMIANEIIHPGKLTAKDGRGSKEVYINIDLVLRRTHLLEAAVKEWRRVATQAK